MKKRILSVLLVGALALSSLVGCGGSSSTTSGDSVELVYWSMWSEGEPQATVLQAAADAYAEETGVVVNIEFKGRTGIREGLLPALEAGQSIDLFDEAMDRVNMDWGDYLLNLEDLAADYEETYAITSLTDLARSFHETGELHSIPYQPTTFGFFYNKAIFEEAGVTEVPTTWEEFDEVCAKVVAAGYEAITMDDAYATANIGLHLARYIGEDDVISLVEGTGVTWDDPRVVAAIEDYYEFYEKGYFSSTIATNVYPTGQNTEFATGEAAMNLNGAWLPNETSSFTSDDFEWGFFAYPEVENGVDPITTNYVASQVFGINAECEYPEEAFGFIEFVTTGEYDAMMVEEALVIPTDATNDAWPEELLEVQDAFNYTEDAYMWAAGVETNVDLTPILKENTIKLMSGALTADEFIQAMLDAM